MSDQAGCVIELVELSLPTFSYMHVQTMPVLGVLEMNSGFVLHTFNSIFT